jgi:hypothetical protein
LFSPHDCTLELVCDQNNVAKVRQEGICEGEIEADKIAPNGIGTPDQALCLNMSSHSKLKTHRQQPLHLKIDTP